MLQIPSLAQSGKIFQLQDNFSAFHARGGLNILGLQDMYLDTSGANSSATLSPPITPVTPDPSTSAQSTHFPFLADSAATANSLLMQRQYHYHLLLQQQQQLAMAQHQLALAASAAAASASHQQTDEIARSLKIFAQVTTGAAGKKKWRIWRRLKQNSQKQCAGAR